MKTTIKILGVLLILLASVSSAMAAGQQNATVNVSASIGTVGNAPVINKMFVLADDDPLTPGTQVNPIPGVGNDKSYKDFYKYAIVSDPNGIADIVTVYEQLFYPNNTQVTSEVTCNDITGNVAEYTQALKDAVNASLISSADYTNYTVGLQASKARYKIFKIKNSLSNCDPAGSYRVYFKVADRSGGYNFDNTNFDYTALKAIGLDFDSVNYGSVSVGIRKVIGGDEDWSTPALPTIKNEGNDPLKIEIKASKLKGDTLGQYVQASDLSAELGAASLPQLSESFQLLDSPLIPCTPTQIDFDITPSYGTTTDNYRGTIAVKISTT